MIARSRLSQTMSRRADSRTDEHNMSLVDGSASTYRVPERVQVPRSGPERGAAEHRRVTEALIKALEEASAAPAAPASPRRTYEKLQFDWPDVTPSELDCLRQAVLKDLPAALALFPVTTNLVSAIEEGAQVHARAQHASSPGKSTSLQQQVESAEQRAVRLAYQRLAAAILTCVLQLLQMPDDYAASRLRQLAVPVSALAVGEADVWQADGDGDGDGSAHVVDGAPLGNDRDHDGSESSDWEDLPHPPSTIPCHKTTHDTASHATDVGEKLSWLLSRFGWNMLDLPGVWSETNLTGACEQERGLFRSTMLPCYTHWACAVAHEQHVRRSQPRSQVWHCAPCAQLAMGERPGYRTCAACCRTDGARHRKQPWTRCCRMYSSCW